MGYPLQSGQRRRTAHWRQLITGQPSRRDRATPSLRTEAYTGNRQARIRRDRRCDRVRQSGCADGRRTSRGGLTAIATSAARCNSPEQRSPPCAATTRRRSTIATPAAAAAPSRTSDADRYIAAGANTSAARGTTEARHGNRIERAGSAAVGLAVVEAVTPQASSPAMRAAIGTVRVMCGDDGANMLFERKESMYDSMHRPVCC